MVHRNLRLTGIGMLISSTKLNTTGTRKTEDRAEMKLALLKTCNLSCGLTEWKNSHKKQLLIGSKIWLTSDQQKRIRVHNLEQVSIHPTTFVGKALTPFRPSESHPWPVSQKGNIEYYHEQCLLQKT
jgi:hypothetical protein